MEKMWDSFDPEKNKQYVSVTDNVNSIKEKLIKEYNRWKIETTEKKDCKFNRAKILLKNKDLGRVRPIVSFFKFVRRKIVKKIF